MHNHLYPDALNLLGINLTQRQLSCYERYERLLLEWIVKINLTAIREPEGIRTKHFLEFAHLHPRLA